MFARYAYAPNALGYCGPPLGATLRDGSVDDVRSAATKFSGAWPYLRVLSALTGIADPLDYRLVESYWLGGGVGATIDPTDFVDALLSDHRPAGGPLLVASHRRSGLRGGRLTTAFMCSASTRGRASLAAASTSSR